MTPLTLQRWRGLKALLQDGVQAGSHAVERVHRATAQRPFAVLERVPLVSRPARAVHLVHDAILTGVYGLIRLSTRATGEITDLVLDLVEPESEVSDRGTST